MATELDRCFLARDAYEHWARRIGEAENSIVIFSPCVDSLLIGLLANATQTDVVIVTSLKPDVVGWGYRDHLLGVQSLLSQGLHVRASPQHLSATALLCDSRLVSVGSQPFTEEARGFAAATLGPANDIRGSDFAEVLQDWQGSARTVESTLVAELLDMLADSMDDVADARQGLVSGFDALMEEKSETDEKLLGVHIVAELDEEGETTYRFAVGAPPPLLAPVADGLGRALASPYLASNKRTFARLRQVGSSWDPYPSLVPDVDVDMTIWTQADADGAPTTVRLHRLLMYPLILNPSGRMAFARVGRRRISYVRQAVDWSDPVLIGDRLYTLKARFPKQHFEQENMHLVVRPTARPAAGVELGVRFDGTSGTLTRLISLQDGESDIDPTGQTALLRELTVHLSDASVLEGVLRSALKPFRYKTLGRDNHNADEFFPEGWLELALFKFGDRSVVTATDLHP
ncbi:hypothetical protein [Tessaracoccus sp. MC1756]|uniref:hypothetical protein n=1 Tax=Tessaracoccus sp. MC1756 TaxID=2760311 RepID=UPI0016012D85|nr:hypothetical protein [Tessaracoccus sp. MC1756]MBB1510638.1 hypothetical protein [Tessaracoccus sp. MC1756]